MPWRPERNPTAPVAARSTLTKPAAIAPVNLPKAFAKSSAGVSEWKMIQSLDLNNTQVSDLAPLAGLTRARVCALKAGDVELVWSKNPNGGEPVGRSAPASLPGG
jgi:hypothetical protein